MSMCNPKGYDRLSLRYITILNTINTVTLSRHVNNI